MKKGMGFPALVIGSIIAVVAIFVIFIKLQNAPPSNDTIIFFYGDTCPHCANVEEFFVENKVEEKISFEKREVYNSAANAKLLAERAAVCSISQEDLGVPLLWTGKDCIRGDTDIIKYFKNQLGL